MHSIENLMHQVSGIFLTPVLIIIIVLFLYSTFVLGDFIMQLVQRKKNFMTYHDEIEGWRNRAKVSVEQNESKTPVTNPPVTITPVTIKGFDLFNFATKRKSYTENTLTVYALKNLETLRVVTRIAPMLGLVATMIPMGPALKSLANGNIQGISENLVVAFSAVIFGLIIASVTFWIAAVKKRWLANEMVDLLAFAENIDATPSTTQKN